MSMQSRVLNAMPLTFFLTFVRKDFDVFVL